MHFIHIFGLALFRNLLVQGEARPTQYFNDQNLANGAIAYLDRYVCYSKLVEMINGPKLRSGLKGTRS